MSVKNIMFQLEELIKNTVTSCASLYGFSVEEALAKIDSNGNLIIAVKDKAQKAAEKAEKQRALKEQKEAKEAEKALIKEQKEALKEQKDTLKEQKEALKEQKEALKEQKEVEKALIKEQKETLKEQKEALIKEQKEAEKIQKEALKAEKESKKVKKVVVTETCAVSHSKSEDDDCFILFQNVPLMNEINSILDVKKFKNYKKLSAGVRLARQLLDI